MSLISRHEPQDGPRWKMRVTWDPEPLPEPQLAPDLSSMSALERAADILRYRLLKIEYTLSPNGTLRAWARLCLRIALIIATPLLLLGPILALALAGLADLTESIARICVNVLKAVAAIATVVLVIAAFAASHRRNRNH